jgi:hypothetical protein
MLHFSPAIFAEGTVMSINPSRIVDLKEGDTFKINVTISNVIDLYGWQFKIAYRNNALNASSISEGSFLKKDGASTFFLIVEFNDNYNATHGIINAACARMAAEAGVNGTGVLASVTFKVKAAFTTALHLYETKLIDSADPFGNPIPHTTEDGEVYVGLHDVAVIGVTASANRVYKGEPVQINVTVRNNGEYAETFNVSAYYDANIIGTRTVNSLASLSTVTLSFTWDTSYATPDMTYTIKAQATNVPGETNLTNNLFIDGTVTVSSVPIFLIKITGVVPCNQSGYPRTSFELGAIGYFKVTVNTTSIKSETVLVTVNVYDSLNRTLGVVSFKGNLMPGVSTFILGLPIPSSASRGFAKVYANAFTDWPYYGGVPYCPEVFATFEIVNP